jgi:hypothetical protein
VEPALVDLARPGSKDRIVGPENPSDWGITDVDAYWQ